eukprot:Pgem_evm1s4495
MGLTSFIDTSGGLSYEGDAIDFDEPLPKDPCSHLIYKADGSNPLQTTCEYYQCVSERHPCGSNGYAEGYGGKYCKRFQELKPNLSTKGQRWVELTTQCLQSEFSAFYEGDNSKSCDVLSKKAFDSHPKCYTQTGANVCDLPFLDIWKVGNTPDKLDLVKWSGMKQAIQ